MKNKTQWQPILCTKLAKWKEHELAKQKTSLVLKEADSVVCYLLGRYHSEGACWRGTRGAASGACLQACLLHESQHHTSHTVQPHQHSRSPQLVPSHKHHTGSSSLLTESTSLLFLFQSRKWSCDELRETAEGRPREWRQLALKRDEGEDKLANMFQLFVVIVILCIFWGCEKRTCGCGWLLELVDTRNCLFSPTRHLSLLAALSQSLCRIKQSWVGPSLRIILY